MFFYNHSSFHLIVRFLSLVSFTTSIANSTLSNFKVALKSNAGFSLQFSLCFQIKLTTG